MSKCNAGGSITVNLGLPWFTMWLFTVAFAHLSFGQGALAIVAWPYYLGMAISAVMR
jgi:hypothetical protein